jgi:hypothetical protein
MVRCKGCTRTTNNPTGESWDLWQFCFKCGLTNHPEHYASKGQHDHGIGIIEKPLIVKSLTEAYVKLE